MKKLITLVLAMAMALSLVACGGGSGSNSASNSGSNSQSGTQEGALKVAPVHVRRGQRPGAGTSPFMTAPRPPATSTATSWPTPRT